MSDWISLHREWVDLPGIDPDFEDFLIEKIKSLEEEIIDLQDKLEDARLEQQNAKD